MSVSIRAAAVFTVALLLTAVGAGAFELERVGGDPCNSGSRNVRWAAAATNFSVESLDEIEAPLATAAAQAWSADAPFDFVEKMQSAACDGGDGVVSLSSSDRLCDGSAFGESVLAVTLYRFNSGSGELVSAEVVFNSGAERLADAPTFRHVAVHELGHVLGLAHSDACGGSGDDSVMKAVLRADAPRLAEPGSDDVAGAEFLYAERTPTPTPTATPTGPTPTPPPGHSDGGCAMSAAGDFDVLLLAAVAGFLMAWRAAWHLRGTGRKG